MIKYFFDYKTSTFTYVIWDESTKKSAIIDSVLDYDQFSGNYKTESADIVIKFIQENNLELEYILETHIHADHLTAANYIKEKLGGKICIGKNIKKIIDYWVPIFNTENDTDINCSQFDILLDEGDEIKLGTKKINIINTPGHTPACICYIYENMIFVGDTIFMPDIGTARTDFPGGDAETLYNSIQKIFSLPLETRMFMCHDYPPNSREIKAETSVKEQKFSNIMINDSVTKESYILSRNNKDHKKEVPKLLLPSLQFNLRAGGFGKPENNGKFYIKIPVTKI